MQYGGFDSSIKYCEAIVQQMFPNSHLRWIISGTVSLVGQELVSARNLVFNGAILAVNDGYSGTFHLFFTSACPLRG